MTSQGITPEFKEEAVGQVVERGYGVPDVAARLGVSAHSLSKWIISWSTVIIFAVVIVSSLVVFGSARIALSN